MLRYKYVIQHIINEMIKDQIVVVTADHGTGLVDPVTPEQIDEIPLIVNRQVDLSDINYQWDVKKLILRLHEEENK
jgi:phosphopentomutase